jgi:hypothetical protein
MRASSPSPLRERVKVGALVVSYSFVRRKSGDLVMGIG